MITEKELALALPPDRPDRHPYVVCLMAALAVASVFFTIALALGKVHPVGTTSQGEAYSVLACMFVGSLLTLVGAWLPRERDIRLSLEIGVLGQFTICAVMCYLAFNLISDTHPKPFVDIILVALAVAALWRIFQMLHKLKIINIYVKAHGEQPDDPRPD